VISERAAERAGVDVSAWPRHDLSLRGGRRAAGAAAALAAAAGARARYIPMTPRASSITASVIAA
jgi:hypothetical protein